MQKIKIKLPATLTNLGPGLNSLGLAVSLYTTVEITRRNDEMLVVETAGEGAGRYGIGLRHPTALAIMRVFQREERAVLGVTIKVNNQIPLDSGMGAEAAFWVAGVIGANNLLGAGYSRETILEIAARISDWPEQTATTILGGLTASMIQGENLVYRSLPVQALNVVIVLPELERYREAASRGRPERVPIHDALYNLSRLPLLVDALRAGDLRMIGQTLDDRLHLPYLKPHITGYDHAAEMARRAGASAVGLTGDGPAIVAFCEQNPKMVATMMELAFENSGVKARSWVLSVDRQGVVISVAG
jgi:homoserine kinase